MFRFLKKRSEILFSSVTFLTETDQCIRVHGHQFRTQIRDPIRDLNKSPTKIENFKFSKNQCFQKQRWNSKVLYKIWSFRFLTEETIDVIRRCWDRAPYRRFSSSNLTLPGGPIFYIYNRPFFGLCSFIIRRCASTFLGV